MRALTLVAPIAILAASLAAATPANASAPYPQVVSDFLQMPCVPQCIICHTTNLGGLKTATKPFAEALKLRGLTGLEQTGTVTAALTAAATAGNQNSDTDPDTDIVELQNGDDPNVVGGEVCRGPKYGCGAATIARVPAKKDATALLTGAFTLLAGLFVMRRRRR